jgi:hypothetical protein
VLPFCFPVFTPWGFLIFLYFLVNLLLAAALWATEGFFPGVLKLPKEGSLSYHFWPYLGAKREGQANFYNFKDHESTLEILNKVFDQEGFLEMVKRQFKTDKDILKFSKLIRDYDAYKSEINKYRVTVLGFYDPLQLRRGFKRVIYVHMHDLDSRLLAGNMVVLPETIKIEKRKFETLVIFAGLKEKEVSQRLEPTKVFLDLLIILPMLEELPIKDGQIAKLKLILREYEQALETHKSLETTAYLAIHGKPAPKQTIPEQSVKIFLGAIIGFAGIVIAFILLLALGVI